MTPRELPRAEPRRGIIRQPRALPWAFLFRRFGAEIVDRQGTRCPMHMPAVFPFGTNPASIRFLAFQLPMRGI